MKVGIMSQTAMCEMMEKDVTNFWDDTNREKAETISGQGCKVHRDGAARG